MARSKLQTAVSGGVRDSCSLHRWVLLKNSIIRSHSADPAPPPADADVQLVYRHDDDEARDEVEEDAFMFPDPHTLGSRSAAVGDSEKQWLDSLLEDLGDDEEDADVGTSISVLPVDDDDEPLSPLCSPMSSSDDLVGHSSLFYQPPPIAIPYPVPYPPLHPPLLPSWLQFDSHDHDALPYFGADDDVEDLPVPDAIEDTSDDESDALSTPYSQSMSSLSPIDPASVPLPPERRRLRGHPHVYVDTDDAYFYPFELDPPLPFHDDEEHPLDSARVFRPPIYQEC
ncbi:hypothetical protein L226DRAFT_530049 [Lentinus tigrinus ALCF2SS1-7]|uniref:Uncharacterized protein n=1 Tax=Lentinus tigrinus ALCF2SS1-6 TaxID=1328759 RepID=A0A5C2SRA3_9APHY|nr:hypothetical protein L227DRAFT_569859 [Lentinus tigrinus ALCF2SS1-6]RPD79859.1 hypothetical protein L226DRAFT_530049 [Lentinus tigrinus ALCF2SS1-7]